MLGGHRFGRVHHSGPHRNELARRFRANANEQPICADVPDADARRVRRALQSLLFRLLALLLRVRERGRQRGRRILVEHGGEVARASELDGDRDVVLSHGVQIQLERAHLARSVVA